MRKKLIIGGISVVALGFLCSVIGSYFLYSYLSSPERCLERFYIHDGVEGSYMDSLIKCGDKTVPLVVEKVKDKNMTRRNYAISFLGNGEYIDGVNVLMDIFQDETEGETTRGLALVSLYQINKALGKNLAKPYSQEKTKLGETAAAIMRGDKSLEYRRTYQDAIDPEKNYKD